MAEKIPMVTTVHECIGEDALMALIESIPDSSCGFFVGRSTHNGTHYYKVIVTSNEPKFKTRPGQPSNPRKVVYKA